MAPASGIFNTLFCRGKSEDVRSSGSREERPQNKNNPITAKLFYGPPGREPDKSTSKDCSHPPPPLAAAIAPNASSTTLKSIAFDTTENKTRRQNKKLELKQGLSILIVDDSRAILKMTKLALKKMTHVVDVVTNGRLMLDLLETKQYDLVICDFQMPIMGGAEATTKFREFEAGCLVNKTRLKRQLIVGMSANGFAETKIDAIKAGMDTFIAKPFSVAVLVTTLYELEAASDLFISSVASMNKHDDDGFIEEDVSECQATTSAFMRRSGCEIEEQTTKPEEEYGVGCGEDISHGAGEHEISLPTIVDKDCEQVGFQQINMHHETDPSGFSGKSFSCDQLSSLSKKESRFSALGLKSSTASTGLTSTTSPSRNVNNIRSSGSLQYICRSSITRVGSLSKVSPMFPAPIN